jgi:hypothetical protein
MSQKAAVTKHFLECLKHAITVLDELADISPGHFPDTN